MSDDTYITTDDGANIHVMVDAAADGPWVAFANSIATDLSIWDANVSALRGEFKILRFDQRGHGRSDPSETAMDFDRYGDDLLAILNAQNAYQCIFVGLSMGVPTGLAALSKASGRFQGFVAVDGVGASAPGREAFWAERRATAGSRGMAEIAASTVARWLPGEAENSDMASGLAKIIEGTSVAGYATATEALQSYDYSKAVAGITCPFLGVVGALDGAMPDAIRKQFGSVPSANIVEIEGAGHLPNFQKPAEFNTALREFLLSLKGGD